MVLLKSAKSFRDCVFIVILLTVGILLFTSQTAYARSTDELLETLARAFAKVPDDIPVKNTDELLQRMGKAPKTSSAGDIAKIGKQSDEALDSATALARRADIFAQLQKGLASNPALLRQVDQLDEAGQEAALLLELFPTLSY